MASGFFALLDDVATLLDDIATMSKVAAKKTSSILVDDLAVNSEQAAGFASEREIPVIIAITKGSIKNKLIILPFVFVLNAFLPQALPYILLIGGAYLAFEGFEKVYEWIFHKKDKTKQSTSIKKISKEDILKFEKNKIESAIKTDFILSIEIIIITLSIVKDLPVYQQIIIVTIVSIIATLGVYGIVALIIRLDDIGVKMKKMAKTKFLSVAGDYLIKSMPVVIRLLMIIGTIALFLVAGGIYHHNLPYFHHMYPDIPSVVKDLIIGIIVGFFTFILVESVIYFKNIFHKKAA
jgi:predicted DNA repair protein MutK